MSFAPKPHFQYGKHPVADSIICVLGLLLVFTLNLTDLPRLVATSLYQLLLWLSAAALVHLIYYAHRS
jgi:hypothetical protein